MITTFFYIFRQSTDRRWFINNGIGFLTNFHLQLPKLDKNKNLNPYREVYKSRYGHITGCIGDEKWQNKNHVFQSRVPIEKAATCKTAAVSNCRVRVESTRYLIAALRSVTPFGLAADLLFGRK